MQSHSGSTKYIFFTSIAMHSSNPSDRGESIVYNNQVLADELIKPSAISVSTDTPLRHGVGYFEVNMKKCTKCNEDKELSEFNKNKSNKDGHKSHCKPCYKKYLEDYYSNPENRARRSAATKKYRDNPKNDDKRLETAKRYLSKPENKAKRSVLNKKYRSDTVNLAKIYRSAKKYRDNPNNNNKNIARASVSYAIRIGKLTKDPCEQCGHDKVEAHHWI